MDLEKYMIPCLSKTLFGVECLGCGFQRAVLLLLNGEWINAFVIYPAVYSMITMFSGLIMYYFPKRKMITKNGLTVLITINLFFVLGGYFYKQL